jgi:hypothetical protein
MAKDGDENLTNTKRLMGALLRMPPKPHSEMKLRRKPREKIVKIPKPPGDADKQ